MHNEKNDFNDFSESVYAEKLYKFINIDKGVIDFIEDFIEYSNKIQEKLYYIKKHRQLDKIYILCPGDSPYKFAKFFQILGKCKYCQFIIFPFSRPDTYIPNDTFNYLNNFIPEDFSNILIMDSVYEGITIKMIIDSLIIKNKIVSNLFTDNNNIIINNIKNDLTKILTEKRKEDNYDHKAFEYCKNNTFILNLYCVIDLNARDEDYLFKSEMEMMRCVRSYNIHKDIIIDFNKFKPEYDNLDESVEYAICYIFIEIVILSYLYPEWYYKWKSKVFEDF